MNDNKKKNKTIRPVLEGGGYKPPSSIDTEEAVIGSIMLDSQALEECMGELMNDHFFKEQNKLIFEAIQELVVENKPVDILTVTEKLRANGNIEKVGGAYYVTQLSNRVASAANIGYHIRILQQYALARHFIRSSQHGIESIYQENCDIFDTYEKMTLSLEEGLRNNIKIPLSTIGSIREDLLSSMMDIIQNGGSTGVTVGLDLLDEVTNGFQATDLIVLAGRPGMGKSSVALVECLNPALKNNIPTAFFSLEMSKKQLVARALSILSGVDTDKVVTGKLTKGELLEITSKSLDLIKAPLYIDDTPAISVVELKTKLSKLVREKGVRMAVVDYLQLMSAGVQKGTREQEVSYISRSLKAMAKQLDIPIIALSQLSRAVETRGGEKKPMLSDLNESGAIEADANMVIFCYRPFYYGIELYEINGQEYHTQDLIMLIIAKNRNGKLGELPMRWIGNNTNVTNHPDFMPKKVYRDNGNVPAPPPRINEDDLPPTTGSALKPNEDFDF